MTFLRWLHRIAPQQTKKPGVVYVDRGGMIVTWYTKAADV